MRPSVAENSELEHRWILQPHTERASCLYYMARSRRQGCAPLTRRLHLDRVRFAIGWHLGITLGVCMSGFEI